MVDGRQRRTGNEINRGLRKEGGKRGKSEWGKIKGRRDNKERRK